MTMLSNETVHKLREMHPGIMAVVFSAQLANTQFQTVAFEDRFAMLVDAEWSAQKINRLARLIRNAGFADSATCAENIEYLPERRLDREQILRLAFCTYLHEAHNIICLGGLPGLVVRPTWPAPLAWMPTVTSTLSSISACRICWWKSPRCGPTALTETT
mgnify:FL=1